MASVERATRKPEVWVGLRTERMGVGGPAGIVSQIAITTRAGEVIEDPYAVRLFVRSAGRAAPVSGVGHAVRREVPHLARRLVEDGHHTDRSPGLHVHLDGDRAGTRMSTQNDPVEAALEGGDAASYMKLHHESQY